MESYLYCGYHNWKSGVFRPVKLSQMVQFHYCFRMKAWATFGNPGVRKKWER